MVGRLWGSSSSMMDAHRIDENLKGYTIHLYTGNVEWLMLGAHRWVDEICIQSRRRRIQSVIHSSGGCCQFHLSVGNVCQHENVSPLCIFFFGLLCVCW